MAGICQSCICDWSAVGRGEWGCSALVEGEWDRRSADGLAGSSPTIFDEGSVLHVGE